MPKKKYKMKLELKILAFKTFLFSSLSFPKTKRNTKRVIIQPKANFQNKKYTLYKYIYSLIANQKKKSKPQKTKNKQRRRRT